MKIKELFVASALAAASLKGVAQTVDGVKLITNAAASSGNVTSGDRPGFPVTITQSGTYRLAGNLQLTDAYTAAIEIQADNVTIDLAGFAIVGPVQIGGGNGAGMVASPADARGAAIYVPGIRRFTVKNGSIQGFGYGVQAAPDQGDGSQGVVENLTITRIAVDGIRVGRGSRVERNTIQYALGVGITGAGRIADNVILTARSGIKASSYDTFITGNTIGSFTYFGIDASWKGVAVAFNTLVSPGVPAIKGGLSVAANSCNGDPC